MKHLWTLALFLGSTSAVSITHPDKPVPKDDATGAVPQFLSLRASAPIGTAINRDNWAVTCDSHQQGNECSKAIDGDQDSFWHTAYGDDDPEPPHYYTIDMKSIQNVNGLSVLPRQDGSDHGWIARHNVFLSIDGRNWGNPVAFGNWYVDDTEKYSNFETRRARFVRLVAITEANDQPWTSIAEIHVFKAASYNNPRPGLGRWGPTLDFPIVPVAAAVEPTSGKVLVWSSYRSDAFNGSPGGVTLTSTWDPNTGIISERTVTVTKHDMFCPGISMDGNGQIVVTGGNDAKKTSLYDPFSDSWIPGPDMKVARGYQSSATLSDGRVFTIGGSWSGGRFEKNGEVFDPDSKTWTSLPGARVKPMLTSDKEGIYRADNHGWLFGWKEGTVFQAGPSTAMNWYYTDGEGGDVKPAGKRQSGGEADPDAMCGNAVMYDAVRGKILTFGGSPDYQGSDATTNAHIVTIGEPGSTARTVFASNGLWYPRTFHTSVVLPDGTVFITGGQQHGVPFADSTPQLTPELYIPNSDTFIKQQRNSIVRVYHSISLLLPDGRVFNGGGGLCGDCTTNHFDAQIFTPDYLYDADGNLARRPRITRISTRTVEVGGRVTISTDGRIRRASLIRYGTATHTVNTDQRRIPLALINNGGNNYSFRLPNDSGIVLPGYWMLFVLDSEGVPSVARTLLVTL